MPSLTCFHCGEPVAGDAPLVARVGALDHPVCCIGCRAAAEWIASLGLQDYYRLRDTPPPRAVAVGDYSAWDRQQLQRMYVHQRDGGDAEVCVLLEGLRCSACSWLIERALSAMPSVREIGVSVPGKRVRIVWQPQTESLSALLGALAHLGYVPHPLDRESLNDVVEREQRTALKRLVVAGLGMMQAMMFAIVLYAGALEGIEPSTRDFFRWIGLLVTIPVVFYAARPFFAGAWRELRARRPGMDTPVAFAVALVFVASIVETLRGGAQVYFDSASMFVFLLLGGRYLEMRARHRAADVVDALARLQPAVAERLDANGVPESVGVHELQIGDCVVVADGATVPADGELVSAECRVDESLLSGESKPLLRHRGERLIAGSIVVDGPAQMRVARVGAETTLSAIVRMIGRAQQQRPRWSRYGDRAAGYFVCALLMVTVVTAAAWLVIDPARAFAASLAVLVVACPCAFALAVPAALARSLTVLAQRGVLVLTPNAIESLIRANYFVFDKTGTLSERGLELVSSEAIGPISVEACLRIAAQLESGSTHPIADSLRAAAGEAEPARAQNLRRVAGGGVEGDIDGEHYRLGRVQFASANEAGDDDRIVLAGSRGILARFELREALRDDATATVDELRKSRGGIEILSGDSHSRVAAIAGRLGIDRFGSRVHPDQKLARLAQLRAAGMNVAVIGDGVNDAPALAGADLAVAVGGGAELAKSSADIVLAGDRLGGLIEARAIAIATLRIMRQNLLWSLVYNAAAVPLAAIGWVPPWLAAIGMSLSSLAVIANSLRIRAAAPRATAPVPAAARNLTPAPA
ncbi:MAG TPA: heavy metal translocating P-type ATPase [Rudaea sp.]|nr:heavy metal translocating P-type ATPase [Rudaea sp.]